MASREFIISQAKAAIRLRPADLVVVMEDGSKQRGRILGLNDKQFVLDAGEAKATIAIDQVANICFSMLPITYGCNVPFPQ